MHILEDIRGFLRKKEGREERREIDREQPEACMEPGTHYNIKVITVCINVHTYHLETEMEEQIPKLSRVAVDTPTYQEPVH